MEHKALKDYMRKMNDFEHAMTLIGWDLKTGMPPRGADGHISALTTLSSEIFRMTTSEELKGYIEEVKASKTIYDEITIGSVRKLERNYEQIKNMPEKFYVDYVELTAKAEHVWEAAKQNNDWKGFEPYLEELVKMSEERAYYINPQKPVYDVLLDEYEPGMTGNEIDTLFTTLKNSIVPLVEAIKEQKREEYRGFKGTFSKEMQKEAAEYLLDYIGFNKLAGRLDESEHPFTTGKAPDDVRITTHYIEEDAMSSIFSVLHEGGHAIYEQNIHPRFKGTVLADGSSMGIHESQSRFYENIIGRNKAFWLPIYKDLQGIITPYKNMSLEEFYRGINKVEPSLIRVEADELTYNLHIILRFELERELFTGQLAVKDLREAWQDKMKKYLGVVPQTDAEGVLQDVHWAGGCFGYFPTYALGNIYGAQFKKALEKEKGDISTLLMEGKIGEITAWLKEHIHQCGSLKLSQEIIAESCGTGVNAAPLIEYYHQKYRALYNL